jgi:hypothetical protein
MSHTLGYKVPIYIHSDLHAVMSKLLNVGHADAIDQEQAPIGVPQGMGFPIRETPSLHDRLLDAIVEPHSRKGPSPNRQVPGKTEFLEPIGQPGQQLPSAVLLLPDHQNADLDRVGFAFTLDFAS